MENIDNFDWPKILPPAHHQRQLKVLSHSINEDLLYVSGSLFDERLTDTCSWWKHLRSKGPIHDFEINLLLKGQPPKIVKARAFMHVFPHPPCFGLEQTIQQLIGLTIESGFIKKINEKMAGTKGCAHLAHLITIMAPAIIQGQMNAKALYKKEVPKKLADQPELALIINTCQIWQENSPSTIKLYEDLKSAQQDKHNSSK